ncbi:unnamed protein product [Adineta steineri]|uniref:Uncharacterized protein n=1 Tax=Adineta steineri TaxID=433720 RepID=A0A815YHT0_9BILA|nr:unnamed protein product [Adineta steineri]CAF1570247.1 unnamed protein product [Adineta steineri]
MALTSAEKQKRYRENLKAKGLYKTMKEQNATRMKKFRHALTNEEKVKYNKKHSLTQKKYRDQKKLESENSFSSKQSLGKALKKVTKVLPRDIGKKKLVIRSLAQTIGILPRHTHQRITRKISTETQDNITAFYCRDDVSYQMPGKRDTIVIKENGNKSVYQKRILLYNIREAFELFLAENPGISIARTTFAEMRPQHVVVKSSMAHRICVCVYHENISLLLSSLSKHINGSSCSDLRSFTSALVCDDSCYECMASKCSSCKNYFNLHITNNIVDPTVHITWYQWKHINGYAKKEEQSGTVEQCVKLLFSQVESFLLHVFIKRQQSAYFEESKSTSDDTKIVVQVDFSENYSIKEQDEIQSAHWSSKSISIFTAYAWCGSNNFSFALASDNINHDKFFVSCCIKYIVEKLKQELPMLEEISFFSDGAGSQFKQRFLFRNLTQMSNYYNLNFSWHFFATSHGKGVVDGLGGTVKRIVWLQVLTNKVRCENASDFINIAKTKTRVIILDEITQQHIDLSKTQLEYLFQNTVAVKDTQKLHSVHVIRTDVIECRLYDYSTAKWTVFF